MNRHPYDVPTTLIRRLHTSSTKAIRGPRHRAQRLRNVAAISFANINTDSCCGVDPVDTSELCNRLKVVLYITSNITLTLSMFVYCCAVVHCLCCRFTVTMSCAAEYIMSDKPTSDKQRRLPPTSVPSNVMACGSRWILLDGLCSMLHCSRPQMRHC